jgi:hypothetical protein
LSHDSPRARLGGSIRAFERARPPQHRCAERMAHSNRVQIRVRRPPDDKKSEATNATTAATAKKTILSCSRTCSVRANLGLAIGGIRSQSNLHRREHGFCRASAPGPSPRSVAGAAGRATPPERAAGHKTTKGQAAHGNVPLQGVLPRKVPRGLNLAGSNGAQRFEYWKRLRAPG